MGEGDEEPWSPNDVKALATMVAKYGRKRVVALAQVIKHPARAGRRRDDAKRRELNSHVDWIEQRADELEEKRGSRSGAVKQAIAERFIATTPRDQQTADALDKFTKRIDTARDDYALARKRLKEARAKTPRRTSG